jgi:hypothetical protein
MFHHIKESSTHRQQAAQLAAQSLLLKATLAVHSEGPQRAADYTQQAFTYAEESDDLLLQLTILDRQIWIAICGRQVAQAFNATLRLQSLLEHPMMPIPPLILSLSYSKLAEGQAFNYKQQEAQAALSKMYDSFVNPIEEDSFIYAEFNRGSLSKSEGKIHYYLGQRECQSALECHPERKRRI